MSRFGYQCPECGKGIVRQKEFLNYETKVENYPFVVPRAIIGVCDSCESKHFDPQERQRWIYLFKKELEGKRIALSPKEILAIRKTLGLSMENFAYLIGCTRQSIYNWENKKRKIGQSRMADLIMKLINENIYKRNINILDFLISEAEKVDVQIKLNLNIPSIVASEKYEAFLHPIEEYSRIFGGPGGNIDFSPKLKMVS